MSNKLDINPDRPLLVGPETPSTPFPFALQGNVVKGYGRGSKQLGIPTGKNNHFRDPFFRYLFYSFQPTCPMKLSML